MAAWSSGLQVFNILIFFLVSAGGGVAGQSTVLNVREYGAVPDGETDNSEAFMETWKEACKMEGETVIDVPKEGKYYVRQVSFSGPCRGQIEFLIEGDIYAPTDEASHELEHWIIFANVNGLTIRGNGNLHGGGRSAWPSKPNIKVTPHALRLERLNNALVHGIRTIDSKDKHISVFACNNVTLRDIRTTAPDDSPNTDGLHISQSSRIQVLDSTFDTGDDCVAIFAGSNNVDVIRCNCGPGHGISLGSMGQQQDEPPITDINIINCTLSNSDNGFRIKTWGANSYPTKASQVTVQDIYMDNVRNPITIDQYYCPEGGCADGESEVQIENVKLKNIWGSSSTEIAVELHCSGKKPCRGLELEDINLQYKDPDGGELKSAVSSCRHVNGVARGVQEPEPCI